MTNVQLLRILPEFGVVEACRPDCQTMQQTMQRGLAKVRTSYQGLTCLERAEGLPTSMNSYTLRRTARQKLSKVPSPGRKKQRFLHFKVSELQNMDQNTKQPTSLLSLGIRSPQRPQSMLQRH
mmetsp:Transcript_75108/g.220103  ORF Transcript_75108/g.220103 Transcript_75108/m.220103 type:complete len:123 (+) Transcript_75108:178-546(+)